MAREPSQPPGTARFPTPELARVGSIQKPVKRAWPIPVRTARQGATREDVTAVGAAEQRASAQCSRPCLDAALGHMAGIAGGRPTDLSDDWFSRDSGTGATSPAQYRTTSRTRGQQVNARSKEGSARLYPGVMAPCWRRP